MHRIGFPQASRGLCVITFLALAACARPASTIDINPTLTPIAFMKTICEASSSGLDKVIVGLSTAPEREDGIEAQSGRFIPYGMQPHQINGFTSESGDPSGMTDVIGLLDKYCAATGGTLLTRAVSSGDVYARSTGSAVICENQANAPSFLVVMTPRTDANLTAISYSMKESTNGTGEAALTSEWAGINRQQDALVAEANRRADRYQAARLQKLQARAALLGENLESVYRYCYRYGQVMTSKAFDWDQYRLCLRQKGYSLDDGAVMQSEFGPGPSP